MKKIYYVLNSYRVIIAWFIIHTLKCEHRKLILDELSYWKKCTKNNSRTNYGTFSEMILRHKEYRNLLSHRIRARGGYIRSGLIGILFPLMDSLQICTKDIGPRLFIQHGFATQISARKIGCNCWINQQVTIGYSFDDEPPIIGNGVRITAGAKIIGNVSVGDNSIVGANAVVVKDVKENEIVAGVPAQRIGINTNHCLYTRERVK